MNNSANFAGPSKGALHTQLVIMLKHWGILNKNEYYSVQARLFFSMEQRPEFFSNFGWPDYLFYLQKLPDPTPRGIKWLSPK